MLDEAFLYLDNHEEMSKLTPLVTIIAKSIIQEVVGILRNTQFMFSEIELQV